MELKEIREVVAEILSDIDKNQLNLTYRKYETFFDRLGMSNRRKFDILAKFDYQFKRNNITLWFGKEPVKKLEHFRKGETITFRRKELTESTINDEPKKSSSKVRFKHAGTVTIEQSESGIEPYKHQEEAFYNLQKEIIKSNKKSVCRTFGFTYWRRKNIDRCSLDFKKYS